MTRLLFATAFLLGALAVGWMGIGFVGSDALALTVTVVIGIAYTIGFIELVQYRQATSTLSTSLSGLSSNPEKITVLDEWLIKLDTSLQNSVRLRIEGERVGLPAPVLTPYLVGLLVMLGLLGTFVGMVDTLQGAVLALEGSTELQAIRAGLAAPIKGLGLAFGTSVAGVAASAMLGLSSTLSRRDRMLATRFLDTTISTQFRKFSLIHNRQETYRALQDQAHSLPEVAEKLQLMATQMERMGDNLGEKLIANQALFHDSVTRIYSDLAASVGSSLNESLAQSGRLAGESIAPIVKDAMVEISGEIRSGAQETHEQLTLAAQKQLEKLSERFAHTSEGVAKAWKDGLSAHERSNEALIGSVSSALTNVNGQFENTAITILESLDQTTASWAERQALNDKQRLDLWTESFEQAQQQATTKLTETSETFAGELRKVTDVQQSSIMSMTEEWQRSGERSLAQQELISKTLEQTSRDLTDNVQTTSTQLMGEISNLVKSSEDLILTRIETEETWLKGHGERMDNLTVTLKTELEALRTTEENRGQAAVERLSELESTVATHLASLGNALEEPMTRLIQTASETPRAAAEVIEHLRKEISNNIERDNSLLEERHRIMGDLNTLFSSLEQTSTGQRDAVEMLVTSSAAMLKDVGSQFTDHVESEVSVLSGIAENLAGSATQIADNFAGSATEMSSLGEVFSFAVQLFNESNEKLVENLSRIEESLEKSTSRSDDQLGYYVAQAREIIDHSMSSQKEIFEELRELGQKNELSKKDEPSEKEAVSSKEALSKEDAVSQEEALSPKEAPVSDKLIADEVS